jgi:hypothetical protein
LRYHVVHHKVVVFSSAHGEHIFTLRPHFLS